MRNNIVYNYSSQIFLAAAGLLTIPFLLDRIGAELYSFVAIYLTIQSIFSIFDGGLSGALSRDFALNRKCETRICSPMDLLKKSEWIFFTVSCVGALVICSLAEYISLNWLQLVDISAGEAVLYISFIGFIAGLRLWTAVYRAVLIGYEDQKKLSVINIVAAAARYIFILSVLDFLGATGSIYFLCQIFIALFELATLKLCANNAIKENPDKCPCKVTNYSYFMVIFKNSFQIWALTLIWIIATQIDKLILIQLISLQDFAYFSIISSLSAGLLLLAAPVTSAVMPNLSRSLSTNDTDRSKILYFKASRLVSLAGFPLAFTLILMPEHALFLFINDQHIANTFAPLLRYYSFGSLCLLMAGMTFLLRHSSGNLSQNIRQNIYYLTFLLILMAIGVTFIGMQGAAYAWCLTNLLYLILMIKPLNGILNENFHYYWLYSFVLIPCIFCLPAVFLFKYYIPVLMSPHISFIVLSVGYFILLSFVLSSLFFKSHSVSWFT